MNKRYRLGDIEEAVSEMEELIQRCRLPDEIPSAPNQSQNGIRIQPDNHLHSVKHWKDR